MHGYFDEDEPEPEQPRRDRELTLGTGAVLGLALVLVLVCGLCFAAGYAVGHRAPVRSAATNAPTPAPDQEPLQPNDSIPKPSASAQPAAPTPQTGDSPTNPDTGAGANPATTEQGPGNSEPGGSSTGSPAAKAPGAAPPVQPTLPAAGNTAMPQAQGGGTPNVRAALPSQAQWLVQIAAVANPQDAGVLVAALRKRGYSVTAAREPADGLIHVKIGPFNSQDEAIRWRDKLLGDGYNAVVQP